MDLCKQSSQKGVVQSHQSIIWLGSHQARLQGETFSITAADPRCYFQEATSLSFWETLVIQKGRMGMGMGGDWVVKFEGVVSESRFAW